MVYIWYIYDITTLSCRLLWRPLQDISKRNNITIIPVPTLFASLLNANGQLGPAEIPNKRIYIFKDVSRRAARFGITARVPPSHPFNPLLALRSLSVDMSDAQRLAFSFKMLDTAWMEGRDISDPSVVSSVARYTVIKLSFIFSFSSSNQKRCLH